MRTIISVSVLFLFSCSIHAQSGCLPADEFIETIYKKYNIVGLDEGPHATIEVHTYLRKLIASKRVNQTVDYIILEFLNTAYQKIIDDYISGIDISLNQLNQAWRNGTQSHNTSFGEAPVYLKLLETIRGINLDKSNSHKIRVLGGDPPMDWSKVTNQKEYFRSLSQRDLFPAQLGIEYGITRGKKVLMIYGGAHYGKLVDPKSDSTHWSIDYIVNRRFPNSMYAIAILNTERKQTMTIYSICSSVAFRPSGSGDSVQTESGAPYPVSKLYDAVYYLGSNKTWKEDDAKLKSIDAEYWTELNRRSLIVWGEGIDPRYKK